VSNRWIIDFCHGH